MRKILIAISAILVFTCVTNAQARVYFVAPDGNDGNAGTVDKPLLTIQGAVGKAPAPSTIYVRGGIYNEQVNIAKSGTSSAYFSVENYKNEHPVLNSDFKKPYGFYVTGNFVKIKGFEIMNCMGDSANPGPFHHTAGIGVYGGHCTVEENTIHDIIGVSGANPVSPYGIIILKTGSSGGGYLVQYNTVYGITGYTAAYGIHVWTNNGAVIRNNLTYFCDKEGIRLTTGSTQTRNLNLVEGNISIHNHMGISLNMCRPLNGAVIVRNNFVGWNWRLGIIVKHSLHAVVEHNTVYGNGELGMDFHGVDSAAADPKMQNYYPVAKNNLFSSNRCAIGFAASNSQTNHETCDYNFYDCRDSLLLGVFNLNVDANSNYTSEEFTAASLTTTGITGPYELHGKQGDPQFTAPGSFDFSLNASSPAKGAADDGREMGALDSALNGVGAHGLYSLASIPDLKEIPLAIDSFSSETAQGRASALVDNSSRTYWEIDTTKDAEREVVFSMPDGGVYNITNIMLAKFAGSDTYFYKRFEVFADNGGGWQPVIAPAVHPFIGYRGLYNGEIWTLPSAVQAKKVKVKILDGYGPVIRIPGIRLYGEKDNNTSLNESANRLARHFNDPNDLNDLTMSSTLLI